MDRKEIAEWLLAAALACEVTGSSWCAEICMASGYIVETYTGTSRAYYVEEEAKFQRDMSRRGFRNHAGSGALTWGIYEARVRAFCSYMLHLAMEAP